VELTQLYRRKKTKKLIVKVLRDAERERVLLLDIILREDREDNDCNLWLTAPMRSPLGKSWGLTELPRVLSVLSFVPSSWIVPQFAS